MQRILFLRDAGETDVVHEGLRDLGYDIVAVRAPDKLCGDVVRLRPYAIVVVTEGPADELLEHLAEVTRTCARPMVMFAKQDKRELIRWAVESGVCAYVVDGWAPERLTPIIEAAVARFDAHHRLRKELVSTRAKLSERKEIEKAKGIVMQQRRLNESDADAALRKMAMDQNRALGEVARRVISVAQLLA